MGLSMYHIPPRYRAEWPGIVTRTGCQVQSHSETMWGWQIVRDYQEACDWQFSTISHESSFVELRIEMGSDSDWGCIVLPGTDHLTTCVVAQLVATGGRYLGDFDLLKAATVWRLSSLGSFELRDLLLDIGNSFCQKLAVEEIWSTCSPSNRCHPSCFKCFRLSSGRASLFIWSGPIVGTEHFLAYRTQRALFTGEALNELNRAITEMLLSRGAICVRQ